MKITALTYSRGETVNRGNFASTRIDLSVTASVDDGEDAETVYARLRDTVNSKVATQAATLK